MFCLPQQGSSSFLTSNTPRMHLSRLAPLVRARLPACQDRPGSAGTGPCLQPTPSCLPGDSYRGPLTPWPEVTWGGGGPGLVFLRVGHPEFCIFCSQPDAPWLEKEPSPSLSSARQCRLSGEWVGEEKASPQVAESKVLLNRGMEPDQMVSRSCRFLLLQRRKITSLSEPPRQQGGSRAAWSSPRKVSN